MVMRDLSSHKPTYLRKPVFDELIEGFAFLVRLPRTSRSVQLRASCSDDLDLFAPSQTVRFLGTEIEEIKKSIRALYMAKNITDI